MEIQLHLVSREEFWVVDVDFLTDLLLTQLDYVTIATTGNALILVMLTRNTGSGGGGFQVLQEVLLEVDARDNNTA